VTSRLGTFDQLWPHDLTHLINYDLTTWHIWSTTTSRFGTFVSLPVGRSASEGGVSCILQQDVESEFGGKLYIPTAMSQRKMCLVSGRKNTADPQSPGRQNILKYFCRGSNISLFEEHLKSINSYLNGQKSASITRLLCYSVNAVWEIIGSENCWTHTSTLREKNTAFLTSEQAIHTAIAVRVQKLDDSCFWTAKLALLGL